MAGSRNDDPEALSGRDPGIAELGSGNRRGEHRPPLTVVEFSAQHVARSWIRLDRRGDGLCNYRCPVDWQRAIPTTPFSGIPSASVSACVSRFGGMVGFVPQRSR